MLIEIEDTKLTVNFVTNGLGEIDPMQYDVGDTVDLPSPTLDGYKFAGWFTNERLVYTI